MKQFIPAILIIMQMVSCFEEDERAVPYPGEITTITDSVQAYQSYFDFESGRVVKAHPVTNWELGFESGADGWRIITNSGANWFIYNTGATADPGVTMPADLNGLYDIQHEWPESTAIGKWVSTGASGYQYSHKIYILGKYSDGSFSEVKQITFLELSDTTYRFAFVEASVRDTVIIYKKDEVNFSYYSFKEHKQVEPEPEKTGYDLLFTSYYDLATLFGQTIPYQVGGTLLNIWQTSVAADTIHNYSDITYETISQLHFSRQRDIPGYRWKNVVVDITGGGSATYVVKTQYNYVIHTAQGNYFKMRFLSYTLDGRSGFPRFEFSRLE